MERPSRLLLSVIASLAVAAAAATAQSRPTVGVQAQATYARLLTRINAIRIFDHHAHPAFADDPDVDAMTVPPSNEPVRLRPTNPELVVAAHALFDYPYADMKPDHAAWLKQKKAELRKSGGRAYFSHVLDQIGVDTSFANRVAMADYLEPTRFPWVFFVDCLMFPFDNSAQVAQSPDKKVYMPMQEQVLRRYLKQAGLDRVPAGFAEYLAFVSRTVEQNQKAGGVAIKFEAPYFRSLQFKDVPREVAAAVYDKYRAGGIPAPDEYKAFQDFIFRYLVVEAGRLHLPVHIHTAVGAGDYFSLRAGNVMNLENVLRDPRYLDTIFVLIHGGYPFDRQAIWLAAMKNVYLDSSETELLLYPNGMKELLRNWLETFPEKITFGSDAFPYDESIGVEETYWLGVKSSRTALAAALAEMVVAGEITEARAIEYAHGYLHDNAARLYTHQ